MGRGVESNLPSRRGWTRSYFNFNSGGCNFILRPTLLILEPPLQIIIAQSLSASIDFTPKNNSQKLMLSRRY